MERLRGLPVAYCPRAEDHPERRESARARRSGPRPTTSQRAFEALRTGPRGGYRGGQDGNEAAVELLSKAIEADPQFVVAQYTLGAVHQNLGNRWKAAAQFRASTQLDPTYPGALQGARRPLPHRAAPALRPGDRGVRQGHRAPAVLRRRARGAGRRQGGQGRRGRGGRRVPEGAGVQPAQCQGAREPGQALLLGEGALLRVGQRLQEGDRSGRAAPSRRAWAWRRSTRTRGSTRRRSRSTARWSSADGKNTGALYNLALVYEKVDPKESIALWERYIALAGRSPSEKDWVDVAKLHLRKLRNQQEKSN